MDENLDIKKIVEKIKNKILEDSDETISIKNIVNHASEYTSKNLTDSKDDSLKTRKIIKDFEKLHNKSKIEPLNGDSLDENLIQANTSYDIQTISRIETFKPKIIRNFVLKFRNIIQNEVRFALNPIVTKQIKFNIHIVRSVNDLKKFFDAKNETQTLRTNEIDRKQTLLTDEIKTKQTLLTDEIKTKQTLLTDEIKTKLDIGFSKFRDSDEILITYLAYMFYLERKPTIDEIKSRFPHISNPEKFIDVLKSVEKSEEAIKIQRNKLKFKGVIVSDSNTAYKKIDDHIIHFFLHDQSYLEPFTNNQLYEPEETILLKKLLKKDMNVINIGANIGYFTLLAARQVGPQGKVFAFEPFPKTVELLKKNIDINGYSNVEIVPMAVSDEVKKSKLALKSESTHNFIIESSTSEYPTIDVSITTIDDYIKNHKIDFVIMDAEGCEPLIFDGMLDTIAKNPQIQIITEFNPYTLNMNGYSGKDFIQKIEHLGFTISIINSKLTSKNMIKEELNKIKYPNNVTLHLTKS